MAGSFIRRPAGRAIFALAAIFVCWTFRSHRINPDGQAFQQKFESAVPAAGAFVTHDEILEFVVHCKFWLWTSAHWGWNVAESYQVLSCLAGGVFVVLLLTYGAEIAPEESVALAALVLTGGFVQLFFGDVENYTLTAVAILAYIFASERFLQRKTSIVWPSVLLALAVMFHLLAGFLGPSLLYLWFIAIKRGERQRVIVAALGAAAVIAATFAAVQIFWNVPVSAFLSSHASGNGGRYREVLAHPSLAHYSAQLRLLLLLCPAAFLLIPLAIANLIPRTERNIHLGLATIFMLLFFFVWFPALGPREDWNLFANVAIPTSLLVWTSSLAARQRVRYGAAIVVFIGIIGAVAALQTAAWILTNHQGPVGLY